MRHDLDPAVRDWMLDQHREQIELAKKMRKAHQALPEPKAARLVKKVIAACVIATFSLLAVAFIVSEMPIPGGTK